MRTVVVTRYGRRAAMLIPLDELSRVPKPLKTPSETPAEPESVPDEIVDPLERRIFEEISQRGKARPQDFGPDAIATSRALTRMELAGWITKGEWSSVYRLVPRASRR
jgi:hypothetical protein